MFRNVHVRWRIAIPYIILVVFAMAGVALYLSKAVRQFYIENLREQLIAEAKLLAEAVGPALLVGESAPAIDSLASEYASLVSGRITIIAPDGTVIGDSHEDPAFMDSHALRPEVRQALTKGQGVSIRSSRTVGYEMMYVAVPVVAGDNIIGVVRIAVALRDIEANVDHLQRIILATTILAAGLVVLVAFLVAETLAQPIRQLAEVAQRIERGDWDARFFPSRQDEIAVLALALNRMAEKLRVEVAKLGQERSRLGAVLTHMADGVLITDHGGRVQLINPAAAKLLNINEQDALGRTFAQVARHHELIELWNRCREAGEEQVGAAEVGQQKLFLQAIITPLRQMDSPGYLVILQDLTRIHRLETIRRDFIGNISHELRTPLTSLKALVETLRDGAIADPSVAPRFLDDIEMEVDALTQIVSELLELSRIESGQVPIRLRPTDPIDIIKPPVERLRPQAERAGVHLDIEVPSGLPQVLADKERSQQVVTNLVHNAIKFTPAGGKITISAEVRDNDVVIWVQDTGVGISAEDLPRIFERFYKADRARSGEGTGLGLAIAKHIVQAHGGRIWAESVEGQGSTFYFTLLAANNRLAQGSG